DRLYADFRTGKLKMLVVSKVANFAIDLPDANVAIQVSGTFGSRQEEAQRLGRILRPKKDGSIANFYSLVTHDTKDQDFSTNRQLFLTEQGYSYSIVDATTILPDLTARLARMQAEFEEKRLSGELDLEVMRERRTKAASEGVDQKPKIQSRKKAEPELDTEAEVEMEADIAAGAEDQTHHKRERPTKKAANRDHLRLVK
ncbi:MAG: helicase-related protein, partial [Chloroflexia bacterium]